VMDLVSWVPRFPRVGETLMGTRFEMFVGGKGFNQAVTAARCGAQVTMVGKAGDDLFADRFFAVMEREGIDGRFVVRDSENGTAIGLPMINAQGQNAIINIPRANMALTPTDVERAHQNIAGADVLLLQLEVPVEASQRAAEIARRAGATVVLNPAPARDLPDAFLKLVDIIAPNEIETETLTGQAVADLAMAAGAARVLRERGPRAVVLTLGEQGALSLDDDGEWHVPAHPVTVVDPTAAGDAFIGALAVKLAEGRPLREGIRFANAAGALACTVAGAEPSLPIRAQVEQVASGQVPNPE
jgi:ribokinase